MVLYFINKKSSSIIPTASQHNFFRVRKKKNLACPERQMVALELTSVGAMRHLRYST